MQTGPWALAPTDDAVRTHDHGASTAFSAHPPVTRRDRRARERAAEGARATTPAAPTGAVFRVVPRDHDVTTHAARREEPAGPIPSRRRSTEVHTASLPLRRERSRAKAPLRLPSLFLTTSAAVSKQGRASRGFAVTAMGFAALIAVATSVPANALLTASDVAAQAAAARKSTETGRQQFIAQDGDGPNVERDGFRSSTVAQLALQRGIRAEDDTFVNNPNGTVQWPFAVGVHIGDRFGHRNCDDSCTSNHLGQDFNPGVGAPIQAIADGHVRVAERGAGGALGVHVVIDHVIDGQHVSSLYAHMQVGSMPLNVGDFVRVAEHIGDVGNTGLSTGPHLHLGILLNGTDYVDPLAFLRKHAN